MTLYSLDYPLTQPPPSPFFLLQFSKSIFLHKVTFLPFSSFSHIFLFVCVVTFGLFFKLMFSFQEGSSLFHSHPIFLLLPCNNLIICAGDAGLFLAAFWTFPLDSLQVSQTAGTNHQTHPLVSHPVSLILE